MPSIVDRLSQLTSDEQFEAPTTGPFGGIQSELPPTEIESLGFLDINNFLLRKGAAYVRPGYVGLTAMPGGNEVILGIANFFNNVGQLIQCVLTPTRLLQWTSGGGGSFTVITGPGFTASPNNLWSWDVLNYKLCFSQGVDKLFTWDGVAGSYVQIAAAQPFQYIAEIGTHLFGINAVAFPQRYYWSGIGDPTDWTSPSSGLNDVVNNMGPIYGILKLGQYGFGFHHNGIMQIVPTGIGINPFAFYTLSNRFPGLYAPYSLSGYVEQGQEFAVYLGIDNVVIFNGTSVEPIGDMPLGDRRRIGARSRILADVQSAVQTTIYGFVTYSIAGQAYKAYWLIIPGISVWCFNFDEGNWTRFTYGAKIISLMGLFNKFGGITIGQLSGTIGSQTWSPASLASQQAFPGVLLGFQDTTNGFIDFTQPSEQPATITSGRLIFSDRRHKKSVKRFRLSFLDLGSATFTVTITNEKGQSQNFTFTLGTTSSDVLNYVQEFNLPGLRFTYVVSVPAGTQTALVELTPVYVVAGEQRCGLVEN